MDWYIQILCDEDKGYWKKVLLGIKMYFFYNCLNVENVFHINMNLTVKENAWDKLCAGSCSSHNLQNHQKHNPTEYNEHYSQIKRLEFQPEMLYVSNSSGWTFHIIHFIRKQNLWKIYTLYQEWKKEMIL